LNGELTDAMGHIAALERQLATTEKMQGPGEEKEGGEKNKMFRNTDAR
jgi:hypothetical protein